MKVVILCAGLGTRLKKIVSELPKPMLNLNGKPLLQYIIEDVKKAKIEEVFINLHHKPGVIKNYFGNGSKFGLKISYSLEKELLGTSGALNNFRNKLTDDFMVIYGDTYREINLISMIKDYYKKNCFALIGLYKERNFHESGLAEVNKDMQILNFIEKPVRIKILKAKKYFLNAGIYIINENIFNYIPQNRFSDFGKDVFPNLVKFEVVYGYLIKGKIIDIGTPGRFQKFKKYFIGDKL